MTLFFRYGKLTEYSLLIDLYRILLDKASASARERTNAAERILLIAGEAFDEWKEERRQLFKNVNLGFKLSWELS